MRFFEELEGDPSIFAIEAIQITKERPQEVGKTASNWMKTDLETARCLAADEFTNVRDANGPIIWEVDFARDAGFDGDCANQPGTSAHISTFFYEDPDGDAYTAQSTDSFDSFLWVAVGGTPRVSSNQLGFSGNASAGDATMVICFENAPSGIAIQIEDEAGNLSNAGCADLAP
ncbi:MAG: hypothetical protein GY822_25620 [Deltaproteobacteria bacterium]|nr:hypothetical protein [Deltaproteobacteria bacterium]